MSGKRAAEMTGHGLRGKPKAGFPSLPTALGNRNCDSHIPATPAAAAMGKWKSKTRIPTFPQLSNPSFKINNERRSTPA
jgi:hypothetical protein